MSCHSRLALSAAATLLASCAATSPPGSSREPDPQSAFMARLGALCGQAFAGQITGSEPDGADADMAGQALVMHVRSCSPDRIEIPFHVGDDRSRTWVITRTPAGLRLQHDHRHQDGTSDPVTMYGGDTARPGTTERQEFPVDATSIATFRAAGLARSFTNTWAIAVSTGPDGRFVYELTRPPGPNVRRFRVEFDLTRPVPVPPKPWGW